MCGGGGGPSTTNSTVQQTTTNLPEYAQPYYEDMLARAGYETSQPYEAYGGQRLAYFSPMEQASMAGMGALGTSGTNPLVNQAAGYANQIAGSQFNPTITGAENTYSPGSFNGNYAQQSRQSGYNAGQFDAQGAYDAGSREVGFDPGSMAEQGALDPYMSQYYQGVVDVEKREAARQADMRHAQTGLEAAGQGSLGGYREALMRSETERNLMQNMSDIQTRGSQAAFQNAQGAFEADRSARGQLEQFQQGQFGQNEQAKQFAANLMAQGYSANEAARQAQEQFGQSQFGMNAQDRQFGAQFGLNAYQAEEQARQAAGQMGLQASQITQAGQIAGMQGGLQHQQNQLNATNQMGQLADLQQMQEMQRLNAMMQAGTMERGMAQQSLDMGYQDFLRQQSYPMEQLNLYNSLLQGTPIAPGSTTATYGPQPSLGQQLIGGGVAGLGLWNALSGQGGG